MMRATGIVRRIDDLGRIVIPKEIRRTMHIHEGDPLEIFLSPEGYVCFKKCETNVYDDLCDLAEAMDDEGKPELAAALRETARLYEEKKKAEEDN